jgi:ATP-dependent DNA ligase
VDRRPRKGLAVAVAGRRQERPRKLLEARRPLPAADQVEPVEDEPGVDVGRHVGVVARGVLDLEAHRLRGWRSAEVREGLVERGAREAVAACAAFVVRHGFLSVWRDVCRAYSRVGRPVGRASEAVADQLRPVSVEAIPRFIEPMLARPGSVPEGDDRALEVKFDGTRAQLRWDGRTLCLRSRPGRDCTAEFPELRPIAATLGPRNVIVDGELVCFADHGHPNFERLRRRLRSHREVVAIASQRAPATFVAFDLLHLDGSTLALPYRARRELLEKFELEGPAWRTPRNFIGQADAVLASTEEQGLEGIVAKRRDSPTSPGRGTAPG